MNRCRRGPPARYLSGQRAPQAARRYVKRTDRQRVRAAAKRREWMEESCLEGQSRNGPGTRESNETGAEPQVLVTYWSGEGNRTLDSQLGKLT